MVIESNSKCNVIVSGHFKGAEHGASLMADRFCTSLERGGYSVKRIDRSLSKTHVELQKVSCQKIVYAVLAIVQALHIRIVSKYQVIVSIPADSTPSLFLDAILAKILRKKKKKKLAFCYLHGKLTWNNMFERIIRKYISSFQIFITPSQEISKSIQLIGIDPRKIRVVHNSLPMNWEVASQPLTADIPVKSILYLSTVSSMKGIFTLLDAYLKLSMKKNQVLPELHIAGPEGEYAIFSRIRKWAVINNLEEKIQLHGQLDRKEIVEFLSNPAVFVFPSRFEEAFGIVLIEAMSRGIPVIAADIGAIPEVIGEAGQKYLFPPNDSESLADRLNELINNGKARETSSKQGIDIVNAKYTYGIYHERINRVIAESIAILEE